MIYRDKLLQISKVKWWQLYFQLPKKVFSKTSLRVSEMSHKSQLCYIEEEDLLYLVIQYTYVEKNGLFQNCATGPLFNIIQKARVTPKTVYLEHLLTYWRRLMNDSYVGDYLVFKRGRKKSNGAILFIIDSNDLKIRFSNGLRRPPSSSSCFALILL